ncbi:MAG: AsnC family transcriptional regulator [Candidatus Bathyarchaeota archaeon]|nr:MAG: AsnC family transcriptional regulator [Candidatus Bathyarchaeota archaeon]
MSGLNIEALDEKIRDGFTVWGKIDETDVKILEGLSLLGPRNIALIAKHLELPETTVRYRVDRMLDNSILFLHLNPYHTNMGLKKAVIFVEALPGYEDLLLDCLRVNDYWLFLCRIYGPYEGCGGIWTVPKGREEDFKGFLKSLIEAGVAKSVEVNWTTCHEGIPVRSRWFSIEDKRWVFNWDEWANEVEAVESKIPWTLREPDDWPIKVDYEDLLIIKELEIDGRKTMTEISKKLGINLEKLKYHFKEHVSKRELIEGYQVEIARFPILFSNYFFLKLKFDSHEKFAKFATSLHDKPFPTLLGKVLGENSLIAQIYLPNKEFRKLVEALSKLIKKRLLKTYRFIFQDIYQTWRETIPYEHFVEGAWDYNAEKHQEELKKILENAGFNLYARNKL